MAEYIEREAAYETLTEYYHHTTQTMHDALREALDRVPSADVQPVRHGQNIRDTVPGHCEFKCSLCGVELSTVYGGKNDFGMDGGNLNYCPNCGCRMDLEAVDG